MAIVTPTEKAERIVSEVTDQFISATKGFALTPLAVAAGVRAHLETVNPDVLAVADIEALVRARLHTRFQRVVMT